MATPMTAAEKFKTGEDCKLAGDEAYRQGDFKKALLKYHESLLYVNGLDANALKSLGMVSDPVPGSDEKKEKTKADELKEKVYNNMAACHISNKNWKRAEAAAVMALKLNEKNYKALYRKAKALGELGWSEKAEKILEQIIKESPPDADAAQKELEHVRAAAKERERVHNQKMKGFLKGQKGEKLLVAEDKPAAAATPATPPPESDSD
ncbi:hypothetical protein AX16_002709 [Volvariella volvacea WC 439]|nr:hypothetical protein AX16_002709 [Volvariella volvacea WC 439]